MGAADLIQLAGAIVAAFTVLGGAAWWLVQPRIAKAVGDIVEAKNAQQLAPIMHELSMNSGVSVKDVVNSTKVSVEALHVRFDDHIALHRKGDL